VHDVEQRERGVRGKDRGERDGLCFKGFGFRRVGATASGSSVAVTESEFSITLPSNKMKVGSYTFKVTNEGQFPHNLTIDGPGVQDMATPTLSPGSSGDVTVNLQKGTYEFYCSVDSHKDKGMDNKVQVS
jgi:plastocyanin